LKIPDERRHAAHQSGALTVYCSRRCQVKSGRKRRLKQSIETDLNVTGCTDEGET
jgi:hypothetical protein